PNIRSKISSHTDVATVKNVDRNASSNGVMTSIGLIFNLPVSVTFQIDSDFFTLGNCPFGTEISGFVSFCQTDINFIRVSSSSQTAKPICRDIFSGNRRDLPHLSHLLTLHLQGQQSVVPIRQPLSREHSNLLPSGNQVPLGVPVLPGVL